MSISTGANLEGTTGGFSVGMSLIAPPSLFVLLLLLLLPYREVVDESGSVNELDSLGLLGSMVPPPPVLPPEAVKLRGVRLPYPLGLPAVLLKLLLGADILVSIGYIKIYRVLVLVREILVEAEYQCFGKRS